MRLFKRRLRDLTFKPPKMVLLPSIALLLNPFAFPKNPHWIEGSSDESAASIRCQKKHGQRRWQPPAQTSSIKTATCPNSYKITLLRINTL